MIHELGLWVFINLFLLSLLVQLVYSPHYLGCFAFCLCPLHLSFSLQEVVCSSFSNCFLTYQNKSSWAWWIFLLVCVQGFCQGIFMDTTAELISSAGQESQTLGQIRYLYRFLSPVCREGCPEVNLHSSVEERSNGGCGQGPSSISITREIMLLWWSCQSFCVCNELFPSLPECLLLLTAGGAYLELEKLVSALSPLRV